MDEDPAEEPAQPADGQLQPRERPDGHVCDHGEPGGPLQGRVAALDAGLKPLAAL